MIPGKFKLTFASKWLSHKRKMQAPLMIDLYAYVGLFIAQQAMDHVKQVLKPVSDLSSFAMYLDGPGTVVVVV